MRIVFLGTGDFAVPALRALRDAGHDVVAVVSQPDRPAGRGRAVRPTPVRAAAEELGLRHVPTDDVNALPAAELWGRAEIGVVAAFGQKLGPAVLGALPQGCINLHGSLLPRYRGAAPIQRAILEGEAVTGVTVFQLNERWDAGAIWSQRATPIGDTETADELHDRLALLGAELLVETLPAIAAGSLRPVAQDPSQATRAPKLSKADGTVVFDQPAPRVVRRIHGLWSWPAAACVLATRSGRRERLLLARATVAAPDTPPDPTCPPGALSDDLTVQTAAGRVQLLEVQPAGKKLMPFDAFARGRNLAAGDRLLPVAAE
ncbi:MAG: methionyl-tRNA formyltransferase [Planctomycetota bacterium]